MDPSEIEGGEDAEEVSEGWGLDLTDGMDEERDAGEEPPPLDEPVPPASKGEEEEED